MAGARQIRELCRYHSRECCRYTNGFCGTRRCLVRGGWSPGIAADYSVATCEAHETIELLERLLDVQEALTRDDLAHSTEQCPKDMETTDITGSPL